MLKRSVNMYLSEKMFFKGNSKANKRTVTKIMIIYQAIIIFETITATLGILPIFLNIVNL